MADVTGLFEKYKQRRMMQGADPLNNKGFKTLSNEELSAAIFQLSGMLEMVASASDNDKQRFNRLYDVLTELEFNIEAFNKILVDKNVMTKAELDECRKNIKQEYSDMLERQYDEKHGLTNVDRPSQLGDSVIVGLLGTIDDKPCIPMTIPKMFVQSLGSGELIPVVESQIIGMQPNEVKAFTVTIPDDSEKAKEFAGKEVKFVATMYKVKEQKAPIEAVTEETPKS